MSTKKRPADWSPAERQALADTKGITLNGYRAKLSGTGLDFPRVTALEGPLTGASFEWSWSTADHIIRHKQGAFHA